MEPIICPYQMFCDFRVTTPVGCWEVVRKSSAIVIFQPISSCSVGGFGWFHGHLHQVGGNSNIFYVHPEPWGKIPILTIIFFRWVGSTTNQSWFLLVTIFMISWIFMVFSRRCDPFSPWATTLSNPRDPIAHLLRMVSWNLNTFRFGGDGIHPNHHLRFGDWILRATFLFAPKPMDFWNFPPVQL